MRIISGYLKGKSLDYLKSSVTRPLKDLVKESIFNVLTHSNLFNNFTRHLTDNKNAHSKIRPVPTISENSKSFKYLYNRSLRNFIVSANKKIKDLKKENNVALISISSIIRKTPIENINNRVISKLYF